MGVNSVPINDEVVSCENWQAVLDVALRRCEQMDEVNIVTALHRAAKLYRDEDGGRTPPEEVRKHAGWQCLLHHVHHFAVRCRPQQIANSLWACAVLQSHEHALLNRLCDFAVRRLGGFVPQNVANSVWALGTLTLCHEGLLDMIPKYVEYQVKEFSPQDLANTCWAFARLQRPCERLFHLVLAESVPRLPEFQAQNMSNLVWSCATVLHTDEPAMFQIASSAASRVDEFSTQELSNLNWGMATLNLKSEIYLEASGSEMVRRLEECCPQDLSNTIWAYGTLEHKRNEHLRAINWEVMRQIEYFSPQGLSNVAWGLCAIEYRDMKTLTCICEEVIRRPIEQMTPPDISTLLYSFAVLAWIHEDALAKLRCAVRHWLPRFATRDVANVSWAMVTLSHRDDEIFRRLQERADETMPEFTVQGLCNIAWAFVRFGLHVPASVAVGIAEETVKRREELLEAAGDAVLLSDAVCSEWADRVPRQLYEACDGIGREPYERVFAFFSNPANIPALGAPPINIERYQHQVTDFGCVQLGRRLTVEFLKRFDMLEECEASILKLRPLRERWLLDELEHAEPTDATLQHKTTCAWALCTDPVNGSTGTDSNNGAASVLASGSPMGCDVRFASCIVEHSRASDAEFQVVNKVADRLLSHNGGGTLRLDVSEIPCLSCLGALRQFQLSFPDVRIRLSFSIRKVCEFCVDKSLDPQPIFPCAPRATNGFHDPPALPDNRGRAPANSSRKAPLAGGGSARSNSRTRSTGAAQAKPLERTASQTADTFEAFQTCSAKESPAVVNGINFETKQLAQSQPPPSRTSAQSFY